MTVIILDNDSLQIGYSFSHCGLLWELRVPIIQSLTASKTNFGKIQFSPSSQLDGTQIMINGTSQLKALEWPW